MVLLVKITVIIKTDDNNNYPNNMMNIIML